MRDRARPAEPPEDSPSGTRFTGARGGRPLRRFVRAATAGATLAIAVVSGTHVPLSAQEAGWNGARALELIERARERRALPIVDSLLRSYQSRANGRVYFYLDRRGDGDRTLVKTDQIALEVFWTAPNLTKQRIVGLRDESRLPNRMRYHLDHLTVVQNEFGDAIRLGDGDEVSDVPHPAAPGSDSIYDFRLADSLTLRLPGAPEPIRAYEIEVRPRNRNRAAIVGSLYVDRASADIVRMTFTFTPVSYVDPRLDYINISLDNSLWEGRYWLPHEQAVEIRRQIPELDFIAGAVILGRFRVSDYRLNVDLPVTTFLGYRVETVPLEEREAYPFESGLYEELDDVGLEPPPTMAELRAEAARLIGVSTLSGLPRFRLSLGGASEVFRYDRAEGAFLGVGLSWQPAQLLRAELSGGFTSGAEHGVLGAGLRASVPDGPELHVQGYVNELRDVGVRPGSAGIISTLAAMTQGDDFRDPLYASGVRAGVRLPRERFDVVAEARSERHRSATLTRSTAPFSAASAFRPVRPTDEGWLHSVEFGLDRLAPLGDTPGWGGRLSLEAGVFDGTGFVRPTIDAAWQRTSEDLRTHVRMRGAAGLAHSFDDQVSPAAQQHFVLGGRNTLPGYGYRGYAGDVFSVLDATIERDVLWPWLRVRALAAVGASGRIAELPTDVGSASRISPFSAWGTATTDGLRPSVGAGVGLLWDLFHVDLARGLRGGEWQVILSVNRRLWGLL